VRFLLDHRPREFRKFIRRGVLAHGFARVRGRPLSDDVL
jgi:hypothetical protein